MGVFKTWKKKPEAEFMNVQISLRFLFLGIILRVLTLEVSVWISYTIG